MFLPSMNVTTPSTNAYSFVASALASAIVDFSILVNVADATSLSVKPSLYAFAITVVVDVIVNGSE